MLEACGLSIAMGNAAPEVKSIADFIAPSVSDDGLAVAIEDFVLPTLRSDRGARYSAEAESD